MAQHYSDPKRKSDPHALPDLETFFVTIADANVAYAQGNDPNESGWYWQACFPGCLPDGDPSGPFETEAAALEDALDGIEE